MRIILFFVTIMLTFFAGSFAFAAPNLQINDPKFDFGEIFQGEKVLHVFEFINEGDETLKIDRVRSSCGCTAVMVSEKSIPPGGKGELQANFDSTRFRNDVSKTIYLYSNDPVRPVMQFQIKGTILETVAVEPRAELDLKEKRGEVSTETLPNIVRIFYQIFYKYRLQRVMLS